MTTIFRLDSSIRTEGSVSRAVADTLEASIIEPRAPTRPSSAATSARPGRPPTCGRRPPSPASSPRPTGRPSRPRPRPTPPSSPTSVEAADVLVVATSLYNFGVSQHLKAWIDTLITDPRFAPGRRDPVKGKPAFLVVARGGGYGEGTPREGWDHATAYLSASSPTSGVSTSTSSRPN